MHKRLDLEKQAERRKRKTDTTLLNMMRFIEQEGHEKAEEIDAKSEEEFNMEKGHIVQTARIVIMQQYDKKEALCEKIELLKTSAVKSRCVQLNLSAKQEHLDLIRNDIEKQIFSDLSCSKRRWYILELLIMEGLFKLLEPKVKIRCRQVDANTIFRYIPLIESQYRLKAKKNISLTIDEISLPEGSLPGVILNSANGKVSLNNTLEARIKQIIEVCTPVMSTIFYGTSKMKTTAIRSANT